MSALRGDGTGAEDVGGTMIGGNAVDEDDPSFRCCRFAAGESPCTRPTRTNRRLRRRSGNAIQDQIAGEVPFADGGRETPWIKEIGRDQGGKRGVDPLEILDDRRTQVIDEMWATA